MKIYFIIIFFLLSINLVNASSVKPDIASQNSEIILEISADKSGVYKFIPLYKDDYSLIDVLTLDCETSICYEDKSLGYIVDLDPGAYFFSIYSYKNSDWEEVPFVVEPLRSFISNNLSYINTRPFIGEIPNLQIPFNHEGVERLIDFKKYASDKENDSLSFYLESKQNIISCFLEESWLLCNKPKNIGEESFKLSVSDGEKINSATFKVIVYPIEENIEPMAVAGDDIQTIPNRVFLLDASKSYDLDGNIPSSDFYHGKSVYTWKIQNNIIGEGKKMKLNFSSIGVYNISLEVMDSEGATGYDSLIVNVAEKGKCRGTNVLYYPEDTICENKWLSKEGEKIKVNTEGYSCDLFEVCSDELDYIVEEAIDCCDGNPFQDPKRFFVCNFADEFSQGESKRCEALYLMQSFGSGAVYMQDYFEAEMCCYGVDELCVNPANYFKAKPFPNSDIQFDFLNCQLRNGKRIRGWWNSDDDMNKNNIALSDIPTHASIDLLSTGTCVDYAFGLSTSLRKAGYSVKEVYAVESYDHAYNLVKLAGDDKYTIVDTTGNGYAFVLGGKPIGYDYCGKIDKCYSDRGREKCPDLDGIFTCEDYKKEFNWNLVLLIFAVFFFVLFLFLMARKKGKEAKK